MPLRDWQLLKILLMILTVSIGETLFMFGLGKIVSNKTRPDQVLGLMFIWPIILLVLFLVGSTIATVWIKRRMINLRWGSLSLIWLVSFAASVVIPITVAILTGRGF